MIENLYAWLSQIVWFVLSLIGRYLRRHPEILLFVLFGIARMAGTTIQTGQTGVLFFCGRVRKLLEPGFHFLIPILHRVRKVPVRSVTLDMPRQRVATADGLVYDVDATLVYHIADPIKAVVEIDDLDRGCVTAMSLTIAAIMRRQTKETLAERADLDAAIRAEVAVRLAAWGVAIEQAGLNTIAPTRATTRLSQVARRIHERAAALRSYREAPLPDDTAVALLGTTRLPVGHSRARYRRRGGRGSFASRQRTMPNLSPEIAPAEPSGI